MSTRNLPGGKGRLACRADNLTAICEPVVKSLDVSQPYGPPWSVTGMALALPFLLGKIVNRKTMLFSGCIHPQYIGYKKLFFFSWK
jgi:hypothetical protein